MKTPDYKTALVTGASSGIGRGLAAHLAKQGVKVYAASRRAELLDTLRAEAGENIVPLVLDVVDAEATAARVKALDLECGGLDLVVANAGVGGDTSAKRMTWEIARSIISVNVSGAIATLCGAMPGMVQRGRGHLAGVASLAARMPLGKNANYCASKAFLAMWLDSIRLDLAGTGVSVTTILPGFVKTPLTSKNKFKMPFIIEADDAAERIVSSLVARAEICAFPWVMSAAAGLGASLPGPVQRRIASRLR